MTTAPATAASERRREKFLSALDRVAFTFTFFGGAAGIITLKILGFSQLVVTATPLALMTIYLIYIVTSRRFARYDDQTADNIYYLGFLFTLVSIAYSLFEFATTEGATTRIVVNFGIALSTTIFGVLFRILLMQTRADPPAIDRMARVELSEAAIRLRSELDLAVQSLAGARKSTELALSEATTGAVKGAQAAALEISGAFKDLVRSISTDLGAAHASLDANSVSLNKSSAKLVAASEKLGQRLDAISVPPDILEKKFDELSQQLARAVASIGQVTNAAQAAADGLGIATASVREHSSAMSDSAALVREQSSALSNSAAELLRQSSALSSNEALVQQIAKQWQAISQLAERQQSSLQGVADTLAADLQAMNKQRDDLRRTLSEASQMLVELESALVTLARSLVEKVNAAA